MGVFQYSFADFYFCWLLLGCLLQCVLFLPPHLHCNAASFILNLYGHSVQVVHSLYNPTFMQYHVFRCFSHDDIETATHFYTVTLGVGEFHVNLKITFYASSPVISYFEPACSELFL